MKKLLLLSAAAILTAGSAMAEVTEPTLTTVWECTTGLPASADGRFATGYDGNVYILDKATKTIVVVSGETTIDNTTLKNESAFTGVAITRDDMGNLLVSSGSLGSGSTLKNWTIVPASDPTQTISLTLTLPDGIEASRVDQAGRIVGDMLSSKGAYLYLTPATFDKTVTDEVSGEQTKVKVNQTKVIAVNIKKDGDNVIATTAVSSDLGEDLTSSSIAQPAKSTVADIEAATANDCFYWRTSSNQVIKYLNESKVVSISSPAENKQGLSQGFDVFELNGGVKYAIYPIGANWSSGFCIYDIENKAQVATKEAVYTGSGSNYQSFVAEKVSETKVNIYHHMSGGVAAMYTFEVPAVATAIESVEVENAPVEYYNLQGVKVANPENGLFIKKQGAKTTKVVL